MAIPRMEIERNPLKGLLVLRVREGACDKEAMDAMADQLAPIANKLGLIPLVVEDTMAVEFLPCAPGELINALNAQAEAISRLAQSNEALVQAMAESGDYGEDPPATTYMNGAPAR